MRTRRRDTLFQGEYYTGFAFVLGYNFILDNLYLTATLLIWLFKTQRPQHKQLIWLKLSRSTELPSGRTSSGYAASSDNQQLNHDDVKLISLNEKLIAPDKRFKVRRQSALKWTLTIDNVDAHDNQAYYLCQISASEHGKRANQVSAHSDRYHELVIQLGPTETNLFRIIPSPVPIADSN